MVIDTSALLAILFAEKDAALFSSAIARANSRRMSAANFLEAAIVVDNRGDAIARREFDDFVRTARIVIEAVTFEDANLARQAHRDFGKGRHPAALNFGDCLAMALAWRTGESLLFQGDDFRRAGVRSAADPETE